MSLLKRVTNQINLRWAWEKVRQASVQGDIWIDEVALAGFEVELEANLRSIGIDLLRGKYRMQSIRPMAFPKNPDSDGKPRVRQYFHINVRDQVAWMALINIIGPYLDIKMPVWSYGNRLFRPIWAEKDGAGKYHKRIGNYRNSSGRIYRSFNQSWPVFRRHVFLTTQAMSSEPATLDPMSENELQLENDSALRNQVHCPFVTKKYWMKNNAQTEDNQIYWCSIDLKKFFPSIKIEAIHEAILEYVPDTIKHEVDAILRSLLCFKLDYNGWSIEDLKKIDLENRPKIFCHLPTGLFVSGFLANVALLKVDEKVDRLLKKRNIAHFRYVDDHIILSKDFDQLIEWIDRYSKLLSASDIGVIINDDKFEPPEFAKGIDKSNVKSTYKERIVSNYQELKKACKLDPKFPSPLMTKTLAMVSTIANVNFNLLEESELALVTDQLEQMLLVDLPEEEIPEKTRLTFAASRLIKVAECRLANDTSVIDLHYQLNQTENKLASTNISLEDKNRLQDEKQEIVNNIRIHEGRIKNETKRSFGLLQKVLREHPDRVRLWVRAILMCRQTGVPVLSDILSDITLLGKNGENQLASTYLLANFLAVLSTQVIEATKSIFHYDVAQWRNKAAISFLEDVGKLHIPPPHSKQWYLNHSWRQYCYALYCAHLLIAKKNPPINVCNKIVFKSLYLEVGENCLVKDDLANKPIDWGWWTARQTLQEVSPHASFLAKNIGIQISNIDQALHYWRYFPFDIPPEIMVNLIKRKTYARNMKNWEGWWRDVISAKISRIENEIGNDNNPMINRVRRNIVFKDENTLSLYEWCQEVKILSPLDPRASEWTALEIVRQASLIEAFPLTFDKNYVKAVKKHKNLPICIHPANYRVPKEWLTTNQFTWDSWKTCVRGEGRQSVSLLPSHHRIFDTRYSPIIDMGDELFQSVNPVRGLGLLLYGLLLRSFSLPTMWNGPGHSDILNYLPKILLGDLTCSSWTLGLLQGCLYPRAIENILFRQYNNLQFAQDDDSKHDPISFLDVKEVRTAIGICQDNLAANQLSTFKHSARQITPIDLRQLTRPNWKQSLTRDLSDE